MMHSSSSKTAAIDLTGVESDTAASGVNSIEVVLMEGWSVPSPFASAN